MVRDKLRQIAAVQESKMTVQVVMTPAEALRLLLDQVDYTSGACGVTELVVAVLPPEVIKTCHEALKVNAQETEMPNNMDKEEFRREFSDDYRAMLQEKHERGTILDISELMWMVWCRAKGC